MLLEKRRLLEEVNNKLFTNISQTNKIIFVYTKPKVGSTSLVTSLRLFASNQFVSLHIHDEEMLKVICNLDSNNNVTINELIEYNKLIGKEVYVINVYRSPIERKISAFFEKIGSYHFNNTDEKVNNYQLERVIKRFNAIFPHIANGDNLLDCYNIQNKLNQFNSYNKYNLIIENGIKYINLRLKDSNQWGQILTNLLGTEIHIIKDYESSNKVIKDIYQRFKNEYRIPSNLLELVENDSYFNYYYSPPEKQQYINEWRAKSVNNHFIYMTEGEYKLYEEITIENSHLDCIQANHYLDDGCICKACNIKREKVCNYIKNNLHNINNLNNNQIKILHEDASTELMNALIEKINNLNRALSQLPNKYNKGRKDFNREMKSVVKMGK
jgi:hypothetical protein